MSGAAAQRGFIVQSIIAMLECLVQNDWDEVKMEPETSGDKVDFELYQNNKKLASIQVKSSIRQFERSDVMKWIDELRADSDVDERKCVLYLVGDSFSRACEDFIKHNPETIKKVSLENLENDLTSALVKYYKKKGLDNDVRITDLCIVEEILFSCVHRNSTDPERLKKDTFESRVQFSLETIHYKNNYLDKLKCVSESSGTPYVENKQLSEILSKFIKYSWTDIVCNLIKRYLFNPSHSGGRNDEDGRRSPKSAGSYVTSQQREAEQDSYVKRRNDLEKIAETVKKRIEKECPFMDRRTECIKYVRYSNRKQDDENVRAACKEFIEKIEISSFGSCLFLSGRYGVGKTRFLKNLQLSEKSNCYVLYCDLLATNGKIDRSVVETLLRESFGASKESLESFVLRFQRNPDQNVRIIFAIDNLEYAFQRGLSVERLKELVSCCSVCDRIKWIFTIQSEQRYLVWSSVSDAMDDFAKEYGFTRALLERASSAKAKSITHARCQSKYQREACGCKDSSSENPTGVPLNVKERYLGYFRGYDLDMDELSAKARIFESILWENLPKKNDTSVQGNTGIQLRKDSRYQVYLSPYIAVLLIKLKWTWEDIANLKHLAFRQLCDDYKKRLLDDMSNYGNSEEPHYEKSRRIKNQCITISHQQIESGLSTLNGEDILSDESLLRSMEGVGVIKNQEEEDDLKRILNVYSSADNLFWAEQAVEIMEVRCKEFPFKDQLNKCTENGGPVTKLPYFQELRRLYLLSLLGNKKFASEENWDAIDKGHVPENIAALLSDQLFPLAFDAASFASDEELQRFFFSASILYLATHAGAMDATNAYMYCSTFFEFCGTIPLSEKDWYSLVSIFPTALSGILMKRITEDFSALLRKKSSELSAGILSYILNRLGSINADDSAILAETIATKLFSIYPDERSLIISLLKDEQLCNMEKKPSLRKLYPHCLAESTISKICDEIVSNRGIIDAHDLFWNCDWYAQHLGTAIPFFVEIRRKSLNLSLTNYARTKGSMDDLDELIKTCFTRTSENNNVQEVYQEEALYLCRNSVPMGKRSPWEFTESIYTILVGLVHVPSMKPLFERPDVRRFYAKHDLFELFKGRKILLQLKGEKNPSLCHVTDCSRDSITIESQGKATIVFWEKIDTLSEPAYRGKKRGKKPQFKNRRTDDQHTVSKQRKPSSRTENGKRRS